MDIDNYDQAIELQHKLEQALPIRVRPRKQFLKALKDEPITADTWLEVDSVMYAGDAGGIMVMIKSPVLGQKEVFSVSLTHVEVDPDHELASEVKRYQKHRTRQLMLQNRKGFSEMLDSSNRKRRRPPKGF